MTGRSRSLGTVGALSALGAVVLIAVIGLYVAMRSDSDGKSDVNSAPRDPKIAQPVSPPSPVSENEPRKPTSTNPRRAPSATVTPPGDRLSTTVNEYVVGDVRVRDHRTGAHVQPDIPPSIHAPGGRKIPSELTSAIAQKLRSVVAECATTVPADARGAKPRADGEILIAIKNQLATVTGATIQLRDVTGDSVEPVAQCIQQKSIGVATASGDEPDVDSYAITLSLRLP
jgi:hypothetical protein